MQGPLDILVLRTLKLQPLHGVGIADRIEQVTHGVLVVGPGSLFPALHRLSEYGWIAGEWGGFETGRRAKFPALTPSGRKQLAKEKRNWENRESDSEERKKDDRGLIKTNHSCRYLKVRRTPSCTRRGSAAEVKPKGSFGSRSLRPWTSEGIVAPTMLFTVA